MPSPTPAIRSLVRHGIFHRIHRYSHDPSARSYGREAAEELAVEPERVFKTLIASGGGRLIVAVVPVTSELDLKALAGAVGAKRAEMAEASTAERSSGYVLGAISPLGQKRRLPTVLDLSATEWPTIYVSGGRRGLEVELSPADLIEQTGAWVVRIATSA